MTARGANPGTTWTTWERWRGRSAGPARSRHRSPERIVSPLNVTPVTDPCAPTWDGRSRRIGAGAARNEGALMTYFPLTESQQAWKERAAEIARREIGPRAAETDRLRQYPRASLEALREAGLWGLRVAPEHGGLGADLLTTCLIVEEVAKRCPSTAMCYKMHLEATEVIARIPTPYQVDRFVEPMARGQVLATVAGSESHGAGDNWSSSPIFSTVERVPGGYRLDGV